MGQVDHIDIVSSDSENENEGGIRKETSFKILPAASAVLRELPLHPPTSSLNSNGLAISSEKLPLLKGESVIIEVIDHDYHSKVHPDFPNKRETVIQDGVTRDHSKYLTTSAAYIGQPVNGLFAKKIDETTTDSNCIEVYGIDSRKVSSQQTESRNLPPGQPLTSKFDVSKYNGRIGQIPDSRGKPLNLVGTDTNAHKVYMENHSCRSGDDVIMYEQNGNNLVGTKTNAHKIYMENHLGRGDDDVIMYEQNGNRHLPLKSYNLVETNTNAHKVYMENHLGRGRDDDVIMYEQTGNRHLPLKFYNLEGTNTDAHKVYTGNHLGRGGDDHVIMYEQNGNSCLPLKSYNLVGTNTNTHKVHLDRSGYDDVIKCEQKGNIGKCEQKGNKVKCEQKGNRCLSPSFASHGKSYNSEGTNAAHHKVYTENHFGRNGDDVFMYERNENSPRTPSMMNGAFANSPIPSFSDSAFGLGVEEGNSEYDERIVFQAALQELSQPKVEATLPDGLLTVPLLRHQRIALAWLVQRETASLHCLGGILADDQGLGKTISMIALIQAQRGLQSKSTSGDRKKKKNDTLNLEDDDELEKVMDIGESNDLKFIPKVSAAVPTYHKGRPEAGTLVVCPASILRQWARELNDKVAEGAKLSVLIYHGSTRTKNPDELAKYDVVLTTYSIVTNEVPKQRAADDDDGDSKMGKRYGLPSKFSINKKRKKTSNAVKKERKGKKRTKSSSFDCGGGPLARVSWFRVILDEAQTIKNHKTQAAKACCGIRAKRRWCLSGTPIQNTIDDLYSYFRFLKYHPYAVYAIFCSSLKHPISRESDDGYKKLQVVLKTILLRRTKETLIDGKPILTLPPKTVNMVKVEFSTEELNFYSQLEANSSLQFKKYADAGTVHENYASILVLLLRLRQACDHHLLLKGDHSKSIGKTSLEMAKRLSRDMLLRLSYQLEDSLAICCGCSDPPEDAVVTLCGHVFCYQCVAEHITGDDNLCPAPNCKKHLSDDVVFSKATLSSCIPVELANNTTNSSEVIENSTILQNSYSSSKIRAAMEILKSNCKLENRKADISSLRCNDISFSSEVKCDSDVKAVEHSNSHQQAPVKTIVFSQWTGMLDLLEIPLNQSRMQFRRLDGSMSLALRDQAVKEFNTDPEVTVMLMSLKAGNLGLNMIAACHVILLDLWWNPTTEDQAIDRAHRIGQTRPVTVSRLTISNTVEDRILDLQEKKRQLVASAFGENQAGGSATRLTVDDLRYLFKV